MTSTPKKTSPKTAAKTAAKAPSKTPSKPAGQPASPKTADPIAGSELLDALGRHGRSVVTSAGPAVVSLGRNHRASGVVIAPNAVLTNAHNLRDRTVQVTFADGRVTQATLRGADPAGDLVVLDADTGDIEPIVWADDAPQAGNVIFAMAGSSSGPRLSFGIVSATDRSFRGPGGRPIAGSVEHTAPLPRGASGGPLLDANGRLVGINTHRPSAGLYLARPADDALRARIAELEGGAMVRPTRLGVALAPAEVATRMRAAVGLEPRDGLLVRGVDDDGPAAKSGIRAGDLIVAAAGTDVVSVNQLFEALAAHDATRSATQLLELTIVRGSEELSVSVTFED